MTQQPTKPEQAPASRPTRTPRWWPDYPLLKPRAPKGTKRDYKRFPSPRYPGDDTYPTDDRNA